MGIFDFFRKKYNTNQEVKQASAPVTTPGGEEIAKQLDALGYFKYANACDLQQLKLGIGNALAKDHYLTLVSDDRPPYTKDPRHYPLDGEDLFEQGGITDSLEAMKPLFEKMNIQMQISDHFEEYDSTNDWLNHNITINGKRYTIFDKFRGYGWGEAAQRFADILNDQMKLQQSNERLFLICGGNDGRAIFLTDEQFDLLDSLIQSRYEKPLKIQEWCDLNDVTYTSVY